MASTEQKNRFKILNQIDCSEHVEKKNGLSYLSWAWAWAEFKKCFPDSFYTIYEAENGNNYFTDNKTCWVKTGVTLVDGDFKLEHIEYLPVMDFKNKSVPLTGIDSMAVNKTIQRSLTKAVARHGLGLYIYAGEDMPEESDESKAAKEEEKGRVMKLQSGITAEIARLTASMDKTAKASFAKEKITPIIGIPNYTRCEDAEKLCKLYESLRAA